MNHKRYDGLDILKAICALCVIFIHIPINGTLGEYIVALSRIGVPIFFMITGFFYRNTIDNKKEVVQIKKIIFLIVSSSIVYFCVKIFPICIHVNPIYEVKNMFSIKNIAKFIIFNESMFYNHLWYLNAILYVLIICYLLKKLTCKWKKVLYIATPLLLMGDLILGKYSILLFGREFPFVIVRNFLFVGIPYFSIGMYLNDKKSQNNHTNNLKNVVLMILIIGVNILERYLLILLDVNTTRDHYLSTTFLAIIIFNIFADASWNNMDLRILKKIGREYSLMIYIIHPIFIRIIRSVSNAFSFNNIIENLKFLIVYVISIVFAVIYYKIKEKLCCKFSKSRIILSR